MLGITGKENSASLKKIHTANWSAKSNEHCASFLMWAGKDDRKRPNVRFEPAIDRVINLLVSNGLVIKTEGKISLTQTGVKLFDKLNEEKIFTSEKSALMEAKKYLS
jgi:hypothetical protein